MEQFEFERWQAIADFDATQLALYIERGRAMDEKFAKLSGIGLPKVHSPLCSTV